MADFNLKFILSVIGADQADKAVEKVGKTGQKTAADLSAVGNAGRQAAQGTNAVTNEAGKAATALNGANQAANNLSTGLKDVDTTGRAAMGGLVGHLDQVEARLQRNADAADRWQRIQGKVQQFTLAGAGVAAVGGGILMGAGAALNAAGEAQLQKEAIDAVTHQKGRGEEVYGFAEDRATKSTYGVDELVQGAKTLELRGLNTEKYLTAIDDAAATDKSAKPEDVARALGRIKTGDYGEGFERLRDFGVSRADLEGKGLEFDKGGAYTDQSAEGAQRAVDAVVEVIEEKFGGLSQKMATGTFSGAVSQFGDAVGTLVKTVGGELLPGATAVVTFVGNIASVASEFTKANPTIAKFIAYGVVLGGTLLVVVGGFMVLVGTLAGAYLNVLALAGANTTNTVATAANTAAKTANTGAVAANATATAAASTTLLGSALVTMVALGLLAVAIAVVAYEAYKLYEMYNQIENDNKNAEAGAAVQDSYISYVNQVRKEKGLDEITQDEFNESGSGLSQAENKEAQRRYRADKQAQSERIDTSSNTRGEDGTRGAGDDKETALLNQVNDVLDRHTPNADMTDVGEGGSRSENRDIQARSRLEQLPGRTRIHFDPIDLNEPSIQRQGRHYTNNRPS